MFSRVHWSTEAIWQREERVDEAKPFKIPKREVWEAFKCVNANQGAAVQLEDGNVVSRTAGTPQGGVISPLLANLFLHYAFDMWMGGMLPHVSFERYAVDAICHCRSAAEARALWGAIADPFAVCKLVLHSQR